MCKLLSDACMQVHIPAHQQHGTSCIYWCLCRSMQVLTFGYVILSGANILSDGSELLLEILDPGLIGGARSSESYLPDT